MWIPLKYVILVVWVSCLTYTKADAIERTARKGVVLKLLREMVNQTKADGLNLPANATSIRENITDTFSCENRTYGYYADVDNDCQIFHVCLTSQSATGRNTTYRWSFICPNETVFNQEVFTCTRTKDSIPCEESPMFYHLNDDIGKMPNDTENMQANAGETTNNNSQRRKPLKKQNIIVENLMKEVKREKMVSANFDEESAPVIEESFDDQERNIKEDDVSKILFKDKTKHGMGEVNDMTKPEEEITNKSEQQMIVKENSVNKLNKNKKVQQKNGDFKENLKKPKEESHIKVNNNKNSLVTEVKPIIHEVNVQYEMNSKTKNARLAAERSLKRKGRKINRGSIRFKADKY